MVSEVERTVIEKAGGWLSQLRKPVVRLLLLTILTLVFARSGLAAGETKPAVAEVLELFAAEDLSIFSIDRAVSFSAPDGHDVIAPPGTYRIRSSEPDRLRLITMKGNSEKDAFLVSALPTTHQDKIPFPMALYIPDKEQVAHVVLLLPGGQGFEAIGSYREIKPRGIEPALLTPERLHDAVLEKLQRLRNTKKE